MRNLKKILFCVLFFVCILGASGCIQKELIPMYEGDCVDRAIQIRQELRSKGYDAEIVIGKLKYKNKTEGHAWIKYKKPEDTEWVIYENYFQRSRYD